MEHSEIVQAITKEAMALVSKSIVNTGKYSKQIISKATKEEAAKKFKLDFVSKVVHIIKDNCK